MGLNTTKEVAELVGIILGDGSIQVYESKKHSKSYRLKITLDNREKNYQDYICNLLESVFNKKPIRKKRKSENTLDIFLFEKCVVLDLLDLGLKKSPKRNNAVIPQQFTTKSMAKFVLRGLFDTDGSLVLTKNGNKLYPRLEIKTSPSPMNNQIKELLELFDFKFGEYKIENGNIRFQMNGHKQLEKWLKEIGFSNSRHIDKLQLLSYSNASNKTTIYYFI